MERVSGVNCEGGGVWYVIVDGGHYYRTDHEKPIGEGDVDLPVENLRGVHHFDLREVGELHDLREELFMSIHCYD